MQLRFIDSGTRLDVQAAPSGSRSYEEEIYVGKFSSMEDSTTFTLECNALYERPQKFIQGDYLKFTFFRGSEIYTFEGQINGIISKYDNRIKVSAVTPLEKSNRRKSNRIQINIPVKIYKKNPAEPNGAGDLVCTGTTFDISNTGICIMSNEKLDLRKSSQFTVEFSLLRFEAPFFLTVNHVRSSACLQFVQFEYDHAFLFDCDNEAEKVNKMTLSLFKYKFESRI